MRKFVTLPKEEHAKYSKSRKTMLYIVRRWWKLTGTTRVLFRLWKMRLRFFIKSVSLVMIMSSNFMSFFKKMRRLFSFWNSANIRHLMISFPVIIGANNFWKKIRSWTYLYNYVLASNFCTNLMLFIEIWNLRIYSCLRKVKSRLEISEYQGFSAHSTILQKVWLELYLTYAQRFLKSSLKPTNQIFGDLVAFSMRCVASKKRFMIL